MSGNDGFALFTEILSRDAQAALLAGVREIIAEAPLYQPVMPRSGRPLSVLMTNAGPLGWISDRAGYRYQPTHPVTGRRWPAIPECLLEIWHEIGGYPAPPECCLINYYARSGTKMGLHRDEDEVDRVAPVVSVSLGDTAIFRLGGPTRKGPTRSVRLASGDAMMLAGPARQFYHGVDRIISGSSTLLPEGGRFNLTLRRVSVPA